MKEIEIGTVYNINIKLENRITVIDVLNEYLKKTLLRYLRNTFYV